MEIQSTINFLVGSILSCIGLLALSATLIAVNNLFARFWKPIKWQIYQAQDILVDHEVIEDLKKSMAQKKIERKSNANS
jgi:hypothetical protein